MRPILYSAVEREFTTEGLGRLADCTRCIATEERNGVYICEFDYPVTGEMYPLLLDGGIVGVIHDDNHDIQPFDIYGHTAPLDGIVTFYARHISYRLSNIILKPMTATSCVAALAAFETQTYNENPFTFWTTKSVSGIWKNDVPASVKSRLMGEQGSILDVYGKGEYKFDKWRVTLYTNRGNDNGVSIRYGVNLTDMTEDVDGSSSYSAVAPFWRSPDGETVVMLPEGYIEADNVPVKRYPWTNEVGEIITTEDGTPIEFAVAQIQPVPLDLSAEFTEAPTVAQLRALAKTRLNNSEAWLPNTNIRISFVDLAHTEDYKNVAALQRVSLCDRVNVYCGPLGVTAAKVEVIRVVYNVLTEQYDEMELGQPRQTYAETVMAQVQQLVADRPTSSMLGAAIDNATQQITGAKDSHITFVYDANGGLQEILVMDTDNINTAQKVWRWNLGGLGYSSNGYAGPYSTAITQDGQIVADFITTGSMLANIIKGGTLRLGGLDNSSGVLEVVDGNNNVIGAWTKDGINIGSGSIELRRNNNFGLNIGPYGDIAVGTKPADLSSLDNNQCAFQVNNFGTVKVTNIGIWGRPTTSDNYVRYGVIYSVYRDNEESIVLQDINGTIRMLLTGNGIFFNSGATLSGGTLDFPGTRIAFKNANNNTVYGYITPMNADPGYGVSNGVVLQAPSGGVLSNVAFWDANNFIIWRPVKVNSSLTVTGTKSRVVQTDQYADRLLYCYETPSPMFGDIGEGVIGEDGLCYVTIDPVFAQTITTNAYQVFLQRYGDGDCYVKKRRGGWFVVSGTPGLSFGWEIKAKQRDYDQRRLERNDEPFTVPAQSYGADAAAYIDDLKKARISA